MSEFIFGIVVKQYLTNLKALKGILSKARAHAEANKYDPNLLLDLKLAPDMMNFTRQIQILSDTAKGSVARLSGKEIPSFPDTEKTWEEIVSRVDKTIDYVAKFKAEDFKNFADKKATFPWNPGSHLEGNDFFTSFSIPNFYFHFSMAYALLREAGVPLGKGDYLGEINWKKDK